VSVGFSSHWQRLLRNGGEVESTQQVVFQDSCGDRSYGGRRLHGEELTPAQRTPHQCASSRTNTTEDSEITRQRWTDMTQNGQPNSLFPSAHLEVNLKWTLLRMQFSK
jgi:hypothetical protein